MICPKCKETLQKNNQTYKCINNHSYDISKEGYINLLLSKTNAGDNKDLVKGRIDFLSKDYYLPLVNKIKEIISNLNNIVTICDCGCGTGYYSKQLSSFYQIVGIDISKEAIKHAAKNDKKATYIVASNQLIPIESNYFDLIIQIFSPLFENEESRILKNNGYLLLCTPGKKHLFELKQLLYENPYLNSDSELEFKSFTLVQNYNLTYQVSINNIDIHNLIMMTPYYYKTDKSIINNLQLESNISLTIDFNIFLFKKKIIEA